MHLCQGERMSLPTPSLCNLWSFRRYGMAALCSPVQHNRRGEVKGIRVPTTSEGSRIPYPWPIIYHVLLCWPKTLCCLGQRINDMLSLPPTHSLVTTWQPNPYPWLPAPFLITGKSYCSLTFWVESHSFSSVSGMYRCQYQTKADPPTRIHIDFLFNPQLFSSQIEGETEEDLEEATFLSYSLAQWSSKLVPQMFLD